MTLVITDLERQWIPFEGEVEVIGPDSSILPCIGCFGCWTKTPGKCVLKDAFCETGQKIGRCDRLVIVSECVYGGYSPFVKNVLDRAISYIHPYFCIRGGQMHHRPRYANKMDFQVYFYGDTTPQERETARKLAAANALNYDAKSHAVTFLEGRNPQAEASL